MKGQYLTVAEAAAAVSADGLAVTRETVWKWITSGVHVAGRHVKLYAVRLGGRWAIPADAIALFRAACNPTAGPPPVNPIREQRRREAEQRALAAELAGGAE